MIKSKISTTWYPDSPVFCDGKLICYVGSVKQKLNVDIWLKNHPFYNNSQTIIDTEGRVERFMKKYGLNSIKK